MVYNIIKYISVIVYIDGSTAGSKDSGALIKFLK